MITQYLKQILLFILFLIILYIFYRYQNIILFIPKFIGILFAFLTLIIPRYIDYLPEILYLNNIKKKSNIVDSKFYKTILNNNDHKVLLQNQKNECYLCKQMLNNKYHIKSISKVKYLNNLSNYFIICNNCNTK
jgi:hypothetical protein